MNEVCSLTYKNFVGDHSAPPMLPPPLNLPPSVLRNRTGIFKGLKEGFLDHFSILKLKLSEQHPKKILTASFVAILFEF